MCDFYLTGAGALPPVVGLKEQTTKNVIGHRREICDRNRN